MQIVIAHVSLYSREEKISLKNKNYIYIIANSQLLSVFIIVWKKNYL